MDNNSLYPEKPILEKEEVKNNWGLTLFSLVLFILSLLLVFSEKFIFIAFLILVLFIHEMGHLLFMKFFKYENVRMLFIPLMGAFVQGSKPKYSQRESLLVVFAGPLPGILFGGIALYVASVIQNESVLTLGFIFIFLNTINLLPVDPLDGGQLFKLLVHRQRDLFLMIFAFGSSMLMIVVGFLVGDYLIIIFGFIMGIRVRGMQRNHVVRSKLDDLEVNYRCTYEELSNRDYSLIKSVLIDNSSTLKKYIEMSDEDIDPIIAPKVSAMLIAPIKKDAALFFKIALIFLWIGSFIGPLILFFNLNFEWYFEKF
jgi:stage IV sporulation protein FB